MNKLCIIVVIAFSLSMAAAIERATEQATQTLQCITDSECEQAYIAARIWSDAERDAQCRQDDQTDVVSIQLNIEYDCYGER